MKREDKIIIRFFYVLIIISFGLSIYFFYQNTLWVAILLLIFGVYVQFELWGKRFELYYQRINYVNNLEVNSNIFIHFQINLEEILKIRAIDELYEKLKTDNLVDDQSKELWTKRLLANYKKRYKKNNSIESLHFHIKNNSIWLNKEIYFDDRVIYTLGVEYQYNENIESKGVVYIPNIENGLNIRVLIVNGQIKLQIGNFTKKYSPKIYKEDGLAVYQEYVTITSFPLMYFSTNHSIPPKYLNFTLYDTESFKLQHSIKDPKDSLKHNPYKDWDELTKDINDYKYIYTTEYNHEDNKFSDIQNRFILKRDKMLTSEEYKNLNKKSEYDWRVDNSLKYSNKFINIEIASYEDYLENFGKNNSDYYEEEPW